MDEFLDSLSERVHEALKRLKLGQTGTIRCSKEFPEIEVRSYVTAYAMHKDKWFEMKYDKATDTVYAKRIEIPSWEKADEFDDEEEL